MKAQFTKSDLLSALQKVRAAVGDGTLPILSHVLFTPKPDGTKITATDLDLRATTTLKGKVEESSAFTVHADTLLGLVSRVVDSDSPITISGKPSDGRVTFTANGTQKFRGTLPVLPAADFPKEAKAKGDVSFKVKSVELKSALRRVVGVAPRDDGRRYLTGVLFELAEKTLTLVATDSHRLALEKVAVESPEKIAGEYLVPARAADILCRALSATEDVVDVSLDAKFIAAEAGDTVLRSQLIGEKFPNYKGVVPTSFNDTATFDRAELTQALRVVSVFTDANNPRATLTIDKGVTKVEAVYADRGEGEATATAEYTGSPVTIAFNVSYLLDALSGIETEKIVMNFNGEKNPAVFKATGETGGLHVIMPMRA